MDSRQDNFERNGFATTQWSMVLAAGHLSSPDYREALAELCRRYWFPLYAYLRRRGFTPQDSEDHVQACFAWMLEKGTLNKADRECGKFRAFLLTVLKNFVANEYDRAQAQKRGGGQHPLPLDFADAERHYGLRAPERLTPDRAFDRSWALAVLDTVMERLAAEATATGNTRQFELLQAYLTAEKDSVPYREVANELKMTEGAVKVAVHRLRKRYRHVLREEIAQTVVTEDQIEEEIQQLLAALAD